MEGSGLPKARLHARHRFTSELNVRFVLDVLTDVVDYHVIARLRISFR
jgi:hypothetical protein